MLPPNDKLAICFAHVAYQLHERFSVLDSGISSIAVRDPETLEDRVGEADVLVISGLWHDGLLDCAGKLRFIQAIGAGADQFPLEELTKRGIHLASMYLTAPNRLLYGAQSSAREIRSKVRLRHQPRKMDFGIGAEPPIFGFCAHPIDAYANRVAEYEGLRVSY